MYADKKINEKYVDITSDIGIMNTSTTQMEMRNEQRLASNGTLRILS